MAWEGEKKKKVVDFILNEIESGRSVRSIFTEDCDIKLPDRKTFIKWLGKEEELKDQYAYACARRQEGIFEEILEIADNTEEGSTMKITDRGTETTHGDMIQHRKLKIDSRKWMLGKMNPKKYGDTKHHKHSGDEDDDTPIKIIGTIIK